MPHVKVNYLTINGNFYSDGQSIVSKEAAAMPDSRLHYYLSSASQRGLNLGVEIEVIEVSEEERESYALLGYQTVHYPHIPA
jgi:hypothetical protein